jgi:hypothetical protein
VGEETEVVSIAATGPIRSRRGLTVGAGQGSAIPSINPSATLRASLGKGEIVGGEPIGALTVGNEGRHELGSAVGDLGDLGAGLAGSSGGVIDELGRGQVVDCFKAQLLQGTDADLVRIRIV